MPDAFGPIFMVCCIKFGHLCHVTYRRLCQVTYRRLCHVTGRCRGGGVNGQGGVYVQTVTRCYTRLALLIAERALTSLLASEEEKEDSSVSCSDKGFLTNTRIHISWKACYPPPTPCCAVSCSRRQEMCVKE